MLSTIWRTKFIIIVTAVVAGALVLGDSLLKETTYTANATLVVGSMTPGTSALGRIGGEDKLALSYADLITNRDVLEKAVQLSGLEITANSLAGDVGALTPPKDVTTPYVKLYATTNSPETAIAEVNAVSNALVDYLGNIQKKVLDDNRTSILAQLTQVEGEIAQLQTAPVKDPARLAGLEDVRKSLISDFSDVLNANLPGANLRLIDPAESAYATAAHTVRNTGIAVVLGALAGMGIGFMADSVRKAWRRQPSQSVA